MDEFVVTKKNMHQMGKFFWDTRTSTDIKQKDVAAQMGVLQGHVSSLEQADSPKVPALKTLVKYLDCIGYEVVFRPKT